MSAARGLALAALVALVASAHVGSSNAYFEGAAGPYPLRVIVRMPGVIPGLAQISVRMTGEELPDHVTVRPLRWDAGLEGAPPPDTAQAVAGQPGLYSAELWLMTRGSYSVNVEVAGPAGRGTAFVPVNAVAERRLDMNPIMSGALIFAALFLFVGAMTVFRAAVRDSVLPPGEVPDARRERRSWIAAGVGGVVVAAVLWGGWSWWSAVDAAYRAGIFRPMSTVAAMQGEAEPVLTLTIDDPEWGGRNWTPLMPDHGKLMHMFLVRDGDLGAFAHIHPESVDSTSFAVRFPPLPAGAYRIYADIVHESGFAQTLVDTVVGPDPAPPTDGEADADAEDHAGADGDGPGEHDAGADADAVPTRDPDDSWADLPAHGTATEARFALPSGRVVVWEDGRAPALDAETTLAFRVEEADGTPAALEPYMGMLSHAAISRDDGSVFIHMHPAGSINMAAQARFERVEGGGTDASTAGDGVDAEGGGEEGADDVDHAALGHVMPMEERGDATDSVRFPFVFPASGPYRVFVQIKVGGVVETAAFDVVVPES